MISIYPKYALNRLEGALEVSDILEGIDQLFSHPDFRDGMNVLWDYRLASFSNLNADHLRTIAQKAFHFQDRVGERVAMVVDGDLEFGILRMWLVYSDGIKQKRQIFRELEPAIAWVT